MSVPTETELKFEVEPGQLEQLKHHPLLSNGGNEPARRFTSVYFDTADFVLRDAGVSLRVRHTGDKRLQTIKAEIGPSRLIERAEWECEIEGDKPDPSAFAGTALEDLVEEYELKAVFETRIDRMVRELRGEGWAVEVCLDEGEVAAGERSERFAEVELELKEGTVARLFDIARELNTSVTLRLGTMTKAGRGYELLNGHGLKVSKAKSLELEPDISSEEAFRAVGRECLRHLISNVPVLLHGREAEAVHQMRVAIRRLRAAMSLFRDILRDERMAEIKANLKDVASKLGEARDLDVFIASELEPMQAGHGEEPGVSDLVSVFSRRRAKAYDAAIATVESPRFAALIIDTAAWVEAGPWTDRGDSEEATRLDRPARKLAADELSRRHRKVVRRGRALADLPPEQRHRLRIEIKKFRYAAEFFAGLFEGQKAGRRRRALEKVLAQLQDSLGALNDIIVHRDAEAAFATPDKKAASAPQTVRRAYAAGMVAGQQMARVDPLLRSAVKGYGKLRRTDTFWRKG